MKCESKQQNTRNLHRKLVLVSILGHHFNPVGLNTKAEDLGFEIHFVKIIIGLRHHMGL